MKRGRVGVYLVGITSGLIFLSAFAHAWPGWTMLRHALEERTDPAVLAAVGVGWHFGSVSMATFGLLGLLSSIQMRRGQIQARLTPALIGAAYILFGVGALLIRGPILHFVLFILLGSLLLAGALVWSPLRQNPGQGRGYL